MSCRTTSPFVFVFVFTAAALGGDEGPSPAVEPSDLQQWQRLYGQVAQRWSVTPAAEADEQTDQLSLHSGAVMNWSSLDDFNGSVFLWLEDGSPALVGTVFSFSRNTEPPYRRMVSEFHSLSGSSLNLEPPDGGEAVTLAAGLDLQPLPNVPEPARQATGRRLQARRLAARFAAHMLQNEERWELRLLPQPVFHFDGSENANAAEGLLSRSLFAFVGFVTDPEVLLLIEARETDEGALWSFQPIRFSSRDLWVRFDDQEVWESLAAESNAVAPGRRSYFLQSALMSLDDLRSDPE